MNQKRIGTKYNVKCKDIPSLLYLNENHFLVAEVCDMLQIKTANVSNMDSEGILKFGNAPVVDVTDTSLPKSFRMRIIQNKDKLTSLKDCITLNHFYNLTSLTRKEIMTYFAEEIFEIKGRSFIRFKPDMLNKIKKGTMYVSNDNEYHEFSKMDGLLYLQKITNKKCVVIY